VKGKHRADIVGKSSCVIELQHSPISSEDVAAREAYYGDMVWLFDATGRFEFITTGERAFFAFRRTKHIGACTKPVFLDFGSCIVEVESFSTAVAKISGFGRVRSRKSFAEEYLDLTSTPPPTLEGGPIRWLTDRRYKSMEYSTNWNDPRTSSVVTIPKGTAYLPMNWYFSRIGSPRVFEWEQIIDRHSDLANGWTKEALLRMERFLKGKIIVLGGQLRLMPSPATDIEVLTTVVETKVLIAQLEAHATAGRIPIPRDSTKKQFLSAAVQFEERTGGRRIPRDRSLFE
jgi:hypothetical protein